MVDWLLRRQSFWNKKKKLPSTGTDERGLLFVVVTGRPGGLAVTLECYYYGVRLDARILVRSCVAFSTKKRDQLLRASSVGRRNLTRVDEGRKG